VTLLIIFGLGVLIGSSLSVFVYWFAQRQALEYKYKTAFNLPIVEEEEKKEEEKYETKVPWTTPAGGDE
jgi:hypothetical protein